MLCLIPRIASQKALRIQGLSKDGLSFRRNRILRKRIGIPVFYNQFPVILTIRKT